MAKRGGYPGMGGGMNMNNLMKQAQKMQKQMEEQQKAAAEKMREIEESEYSATAGGGAVAVTISGKKVVTKVKLNPDAVDPDDVEMLEDLIMVAMNDALKQVEAAEDAAAAAMQSGMPSMGGMGGFPF